MFLLCFLTLFCDLYQNENITYSWASSDSINAYVDLVQFRVMTVNTYYDSNDPFSLKSYFEVTSDLIYSSISTKVSLNLQPTEVIFLNGSTTTVWKSTLEIYLQESFDMVISAFSFNIDSQVNTIEQSTKYELSPKQRILTSESAQKSDNNEVETATGLYYCFIIMAQIGGFYSFLKMIFWLLTWRLFRIMSQIDLLNKVNKKIQKLESKTLKSDGKTHIDTFKSNPSKGNLLKLFGGKVHHNKDVRESEIHEGGSKVSENEVFNNEIQDQIKRLKLLQKLQTKTLVYNYKDALYMSTIWCKSTPNSASAFNLKSNSFRKTLFTQNLNQIYKKLDYFDLIWDIDKLHSQIDEIKSEIASVKLLHEEYANMVQCNQEEYASLPYRSEFEIEKFDRSEHPNDYENKNLRNSLSKNGWSYIIRELPSNEQALDSQRILKDDKKNHIKQIKSVFAENIKMLNPGSNLLLEDAKSNSHNSKHANNSFNVLDESLEHKYLFNHDNEK